MTPPLRLWFALTLLGAIASPAVRGDDWRSLQCDPGQSLGAWSCAATACHGGGERSRRTSGGELERWRNADPHAAALSTIESDAFAAILHKLGIVSQVSQASGPGQRYKDLVADDAGDRAAALTKLNECLACHNPLSAPTSWTQEQVRPQQADGEMIADGLAIGCETCHGPAKNWIGDHFRRDFNRAQNCFHDLKDPLIRARTCAQCHIGDGKHDMNHDMIAAGHPPLRFDLAAYERALPKHWNDARQRAEVRDYELKLWLAGQIANYDGGLSLLESRLKRSQGDADDGQRSNAIWPEFAESNCSSCHHRLHSVTEEAETGLSYEPADVPLQHKNWNCGALIELLELERPAAADRLPIVQSDFRKFAGERYRPLLAPEANLPADLPKRLLVAPNYDQQLQAYAAYVAAAKSRYDEQHKMGGEPARPAVLDDLQSIRAILTPRAPGGAATAARPQYRDVLKLFQSAAEKLP